MSTHEEGEGDAWCVDCGEAECICERFRKLSINTSDDRLPGESIICCIRRIEILIALARWDEEKANERDMQREASVERMLQHNLGIILTKLKAEYDEL